MFQSSGILFDFVFVAEYYSSYSENPYFYLYFICSTIASTYTYTWDVKMDWGVFDFRESEYKLLREEIVYSSPVSLLVFADSYHY